MAQGAACRGLKSQVMQREPSEGDGLLSCWRSGHSKVKVPTLPHEQAGPSACTAPAACR